MLDIRHSDIVLTLIYLLIFDTNGYLVLKDVNTSLYLSSLDLNCGTWNAVFMASNKKFLLYVLKKEEL